MSPNKSRQLLILHLKFLESFLNQQNGNIEVIIPVTDKK